MTGGSAVERFIILIAVLGVVCDVGWGGVVGGWVAGGGGAGESRRRSVGEGPDGWGSFYGGNVTKREQKF